MKAHELVPKLHSCCHSRCFHDTGQESPNLKAMRARDVCIEQQVTIAHMKLIALDSATPWITGAAVLLLGVRTTAPQAGQDFSETKH